MPRSDPVFYYDTNSPYAYLAAMRIREVVPQAVWRPIAFGIIVRMRGKTPWSFDERREAGIAEIARRAQERGLPPVTYPEGWPVGTHSLFPLRAALVAEENGRLEEFTLEAYRTMFVENCSLADDENVLAAAERVGLDRQAVREGAERQETKDRLRVHTDEAIERGVTGVPTVAVGDELFWGDDRLEDAAAAAS